MFLTTAGLRLRLLPWLVWSIKCILPPHSVGSCSAVISPMPRHQTASDWLQCRACWVLCSRVPTASYEALCFMMHIPEQIGATVISLTSVLGRNWFESQLYWVGSLFLFGLWGYCHCGHSWPIVPASDDSENDCGEADWMYIGRGNRSSRRKSAPAPLLSIRVGS
jgi:hypothetical protein